MSRQDEPIPVGHTATEESLEQVLNSLQHLLEQNHFAAPAEKPDDDTSLTQAVEPFADLPAEQYDDPLYPDNGEAPSPLQAEVDNSDDIDIPILDDIIFNGLADDPRLRGEAEPLLKQLRDELNGIVDGIMAEARQQLESGQPLPEENSLQRFLRELRQKNPD
ncbi:hypothetical protein [Sulfuriflexus mobilis]|uniref:hypothetical protein n=1 Tax=Sulfuriflexus mobilis TaxID=1811807 RepID=UPI000F823491|nr:hypothetical protein [Sulfuriflexus mobilis]